MKEEEVSHDPEEEARSGEGSVYKGYQFPIPRYTVCCLQYSSLKCFIDKSGKIGDYRWIIFLIRQFNLLFMAGLYTFHFNAV